MFGGAYDQAPPEQRPKYGALNYRRRPAGGSVRFGSSHLRLARRVLSRVTFCYPDSSTGTLRLDRDIEALVLDPSFRDTDVETAARELPCCLEWHHGFRLHVDDLRRHGDYRGTHVVQAGLDIAEHGWLDARIIGDAVPRRAYSPQTLKQLWHCTARYGQPASPANS